MLSRQEFEMEWFVPILWYCPETSISLERKDMNLRPHDSRTEIQIGYFPNTATPICQLLNAVNTSIKNKREVYCSVWGYEEFYLLGYIAG
jgi:hypothetical protein